MAGGGTTGPNKGGNRMIDGINVTPLVDIMLVLLVIVMVTAKFTSSSAIPMNLPKASESDSVQTIFSVAIPEDRTLRVDGRAVDRKTLTARVGRALERNPGLRAIIQADGNVPHERVMSVMDALRAAGLTKVAFATSKEGSDRSEE